MRKLSGAKEKLGLRVHGLIVGTPEKQRSDPAVLRHKYHSSVNQCLVWSTRSLCTNYLRNGKTEIRIQEFEGWSSVREDESLSFDWDDLEGDSRRKIKNLKLEKLRQEEARRRKQDKRSKRKAKKH